jgi:hypothetical protein
MTRLADNRSDGGAASTMLLLALTLDYLSN